MNWFKKQVNKLFIHDEIDEEDEYFENDNNDEMIYKNHSYENTESEQNVNSKKRTFRFPLIADEEIVSPKPIEQHRKEDGYNRLKAYNPAQPIELPRHLQQNHPISVVYDVEVSGIRELLEKRRKSKEPTKVLRDPQKRQNMNETANNIPSVKNERIKQDVNIRQERDLINPLDNRKRFVPTKVPSPVYGFSKPSSINELLSKKEDQDELIQATDQQSLDQNAINENEIIIVEEKGKAEIVKAAEEVSSSIVSGEEETIHIEQNSTHGVKSNGLPIFIQEEEQVEVKEHPIMLQSKLYKQVEESPILTEEVIEVETIPNHIQEVQQLIEIEDNVEEINSIAEAEIVEEQEDVEPLVEESYKDHSKGTTMPFNVLMLKSDKEKLAAKLAQISTLDARNQEKTDGNIERQTVDDESLIEELSINQEIENNEFYSNQVKIENLNVENSEEAVLEKSQQLEHIEVLDAAEPIEKKTVKVYVKPSFDFLSPPEEKTEDREWLESQADVLVEALSYFQVTAQVESIMQGPAVTQFEITVGHGTKVSKIRNLADDLKLALAARDIRIQAPIPGKSSIGIEIPNRISRAVRLSEVTNSESFINSESPLEAALGLDLTGKPVTIDLRKMPHGLIAGATGSGKSVCINSILVSLLYKAAPHELKLMLIDPKMVELAPFNHIPHLVSPVITDVKAATAALKWAVEEMERRYQLFAHAGVRDLPRFNKLAESKGEHGHKLPYILIVIDELADLMMMSPADVEEAICRIAQKARACGIHLIVATQRPSVDVITGLIKSNIPTRIAFAVSSQVDSRTILDAQGAERLLGRGDMLYLGNGMSAPIRIQGTFVTDDEIEEIIEHVKQQGEPDYFFEQDELLKKTEMIEEQDELFEEVCRFVFEQGTASTSSIQRKYHIGYNRAARLIDMLEKHGFISEQKGSKPRDVFITESDLASMFD